MPFAVIASPFLLRPLFISSPSSSLPLSQLSSLQSCIPSLISVFYLPFLLFSPLFAVPCVSVPSPSSISHSSSSSYSSTYYSSFPFSYSSSSSSCLPSPSSSLSPCPPFPFLIPSEPHIVSLKEEFHERREAWGGPNAFIPSDTLLWSLSSLGVHQHPSDP